MEKPMEVNENTRKEFNNADKALDKIVNKNKSNIKLKKKIYMTISDVDPEDARLFKQYCDKHFDGKQFLAIKYLVWLADIEPMLSNMCKQINELDARLLAIENVPLDSDEGEDNKIVLPKTQGSARGTR